MIKAWSWVMGSPGLSLASFVGGGGSDVGDKNENG